MSDQQISADPVPIEDDLGSRLRLARQDSDMTVAALARRLGVEPASVEAWECNARTPRTNRLLNLAGILGVSLTWLLEGRENAHMETSRESPSLALLVGEVEDLRLLLAQAQQALDRIAEQLQAAASAR